MTMARILFLAIAVATISSCGLLRGDRETVEVRDGGSEPGAVEVRSVRVRASLGRGTDRRDFTVSVSPFAAIAEQALASARHRAISYCLETYGGSDIAWVVGPDQPIAELPVDGDTDTVTLDGRCIQR
ncbi:MAG: hypothetical protein OXF07_09025 [Rhodobacter sp.]|nr:hypothetical protein [Rhodobacter sp.]MCY4167276.1 hypothetical protein [Rhodobacter sp.]MCY4243435.1 hypothetical protein [Rhodobacter sp.]